MIKKIQKILPIYHLFIKSLINIMEKKRYNFKVNKTNDRIKKHVLSILHRQ